jgi:NADH:ubiquinone oxidoreductase subunit 4 (subunit M)
MTIISLMIINFLAVNRKVLLGVLNFVVIFIAWALSDFSSNSFQFISYSTEEYLGFNIGVDGISIYFVLLTAIVIPLALLSN